MLHRNAWLLDNVLQPGIKAGMFSMNICLTFMIHLQKVQEGQELWEV